MIKVAIRLNVDFIDYYKWNIDNHPKKMPAVQTDFSNMMYLICHMKRKMRNNKIWRRKGCCFPSTFETFVKKTNS